VDILSNNAAVLPYKGDSQVQELSMETWDYLMGINLRGSFLCSKYAAPSMLSREVGSIIKPEFPNRGICVTED